LKSEIDALRAQVINIGRKVDENHLPAGKKARVIEKSPDLLSNSLSNSIKKQKSYLLLDPSKQSVDMKLRIPNASPLPAPNVL
jgi:hypothetical protein